jgi:PIN domain nuclease of toxin-antitoxin system
MKLFLPDTHAIYWYEFLDPKLSKPAEQAFKEAEGGNALLILHPVVLAEFYWLLKKLGLDGNFQPYIRFLLTNPIYRFETITASDLLRMDEFEEIPEMHDRLIAIVAERIGATTITRDPCILKSPKVRSLW